MTIGQLFTKYGSDKDSLHTYGPVYESYLSPIKDKLRVILELGVLNGASLRAWRDYAPNARVFGFDATKIILNEPGIITITGDQGRAVDLEKIGATIGEPIDLIVDDCGHIPELQALSVFRLWKYLRPGGLYFIEDITVATVIENFRCFANAVIHDLREGNTGDNVLICLKKNL